MTPAEFDAACRALWRRFVSLSETSGRRTPGRNSDPVVDGLPTSKHLLGMGKDFTARPILEGIAEQQYYGRVAAYAREKLGLWVEIEADHVHVQGLPPGPVLRWWMDKYAPGGWV